MKLNIALLPLTIFLAYGDASNNDGDHDHKIIHILNSLPLNSILNTRRNDGPIDDKNLITDKNQQYTLQNQPVTTTPPLRSPLLDIVSNNFMPSQKIVLNNNKDQITNLALPVYNKLKLLEQYNLSEKLNDFQQLSDQYQNLLTKNQNGNNPLSDASDQYYLTNLQIQNETNRPLVKISDQSNMYSSHFVNGDNKINMDRNKISVTPVIKVGQGCKERAYSENKQTGDQLCKINKNKLKLEDVEISPNMFQNKENLVSGYILNSDVNNKKVKVYQNQQESKYNNDRITTDYQFKEINSNLGQLQEVPAALIIDVEKNFNQLEQEAHKKHNNILEDQEVIHIIDKYSTLPIQNSSWNTALSKDYLVKQHSVPVVLIDVVQYKDDMITNEKNIQKEEELTNKKYHDATIAFNGKAYTGDEVDVSSSNNYQSHGGYIPYNENGLLTNQQFSELDGLTENKNVGAGLEYNIKNRLISGTGGISSNKKYQQNREYFLYKDDGIPKNKGSFNAESAVMNNNYNGVEGYNGNLLYLKDVTTNNKYGGAGSIYNQNGHVSVLGGISGLNGYGSLNRNWYGNRNPIFITRYIAFVNGKYGDLASRLLANKFGIGNSARSVG